jgi:hypothetical protein
MHAVLQGFLMMLCSAGLFLLLWCRQPEMRLSVSLLSGEQRCRSIVCTVSIVYSHSGWQGITVLSMLRVMLKQDATGLHALQHAASTCHLHAHAPAAAHDMTSGASSVLRVAAGSQHY